MNQAQAARVVLLCGAGMATFVLVQSSRKGLPSERTFKSLWAIGVFTIGLSIFADFVPKVAAPFAILALIAMAVRNTGAIGSVVGGAAAAKKSKPARGAGKAPKKSTVRGGD